MFVIRRKSDGRFWRNDKRGAWCSKDDAFVENLQDVKPFRTKAAAKASLGSNKYAYEWGRSQWEAKRKGEPVPECCSAVKRSWKGTTNKCQHLKDAEQADRDAWDARYELVPVQLSIKGD